ncbi:hypothetical protein M404DRAFT_7027 [Pisolithus tinctorius Marx 270]|uniref:Uncharacterized protein n=1 Tax=Pisolithus tinctorius Marx 270 TaxID=870435 RepID=A0A0C3KRM3_PISTI|nr:hypothetical protein M404DRAFT_7027 [Pisolithus tinctorius Marx 270]
MSSAAYPIPSEPHNVLQMTHNMLATENVTVTQLWATTFVPTSSPVLALVMLVAPQHSGHFPWFLVKSPIINFARSLQPTRVEYDRRTFALTWVDRANAAQFSVDGKVFLLSFHDPAMFWCFKYMVYCRDQVDCHQHCVSEPNAKVLLDAFLDFKIPAQVPLGVRSAVSGRGLSKYHDKGVLASTGQGIDTASPEHSPPRSQSKGGTQSPDGMDADRRLHTPQSQSTTIGDSAGHTGECDPGPTITMVIPPLSVGRRRSRPLDPDPSFDGSESSSDRAETTCQKKRKLI